MTGDPRLHRVLAWFLIAYGGWTLTSHAMVLIGAGLIPLIWTAPVTIGALAWACWRLGSSAVDDPPAGTTVVPVATAPARSWMEVAGTAIAVGAALAVKWSIFWALAVVMLGRTLWQQRGTAGAPPAGVSRMRGRDWGIFGAAILLAIVVTLGVSRSDLDDAFYVSVAADASAHADAPLLRADPMHGQPGLPLLFPSYQFSSFELLAGAIGRVTGLPAMTVVYNVLPVGSAIVAIVAIFLLAQALLPRRWLWLAMGTLLFTAILGETHRSPANMMFVRLFQGKAVCLTAILPAIFYLTLRCVSRTGRARDIFLLGCAEISAVGLSNFGMLAAMMANVMALGAAAPLWREIKPRQLTAVLGAMALPLPYLAATALQAHWGGTLPSYAHETPAQVWITVLGPRQQFLMSVLLCLGPLLAPDRITGWRLALPPFLLLAIFLNPWWSDFLAAHVTTPPVYWRVMWSFPLLVFAAAALVLLADRLLPFVPPRWRSIVASGALALVILAAAPGFTFRASNIAPITSFPSTKVPVADLEVARRAAAVTGPTGCLLAPDRIAGVVSRFERHPKLVSVRGVYLDMLAPFFGIDGYRQRSQLRLLAYGRNHAGKSAILTALKSLDVSAIVTIGSRTTAADRALLLSAGFEVEATLDGYVIWKGRGPFVGPRSG